MGSDTHPGGNCLPILEREPPSKNADLEPCVQHWERQSSAKSPEDTHSCAPCSTGGTMSKAMERGGLGQVDGQREGTGFLKCRLPTTISPIRPSAPSIGIAPNGMKALRCRSQRRSRTFSYNIDRTTATEAVDKKVDRFHGSRHHDRSISNCLHSSDTQTLSEIHH